MRRPLAAAIGLVAMTIAAAGCGGSSGASGSPAAPGTGSVAASGTPDASPSTGASPTAPTTGAASSSSVSRSGSTPAAAVAAASLAAQHQCTDFAEAGLTAVGTMFGASSIGECKLSQTEIVVMVFDSPAKIDAGIKVLGKAGSQQNIDVYVARGSNWVAAGEQTQTQQDAALIVSKFGGTVVHAQA
ncbi:MAG TPA: hypothetical protein VHC41_05475 [Mycobacteriales bacterium]|nr:hypothetical protein [Mycobacteriales bacterium]